MVLLLGMGAWLSGCSGSSIIFELLDLICFDFIWFALRYASVICKDLGVNLRKTVNISVSKCY